MERENGSTCIFVRWKYIRNSSFISHCQRKIAMNGNFSRKANGLAFEAARHLTITYYMNVRVALYTDNQIKIQVLPFSASILIL